MKCLILICLCFVFLNKKCCSQDVLKVDSLNITRARQSVEAIIGKKNKGNDFLLLAIADHNLLIAKEASKYRLYRFFSCKNSAMGINVVDSLSIIKDLNLDRCFSEIICDPSFFYMANIVELRRNINFETTYIYFTLQVAGVKKCEFNFPIRGQEVLLRFPLKNKIFKHLMKLMDLSNRSWKKI